MRSPTSQMHPHWGKGQCKGPATRGMCKMLDRSQHGAEDATSCNNGGVDKGAGLKHRQCAFDMRTRTAVAALMPCRI
jgi:hypothetical protein